MLAILYLEGAFIVFRSIVDSRYRLARDKLRPDIGSIVIGIEEGVLVLRQNPIGRYYLIG